MQSNESKLWLHRLFNTDNFDTWLIISYLYRYTSPGIHYYLAKKLRYKRKDEINEVLPHIVHICETFNSQPLYNFLCELSIECYFLVRDKKEMCDEILVKYKKKSKMIQGSKKNLYGKIDIESEGKNIKETGNVFSINYVSEDKHNKTNTQDCRTIEAYKRNDQGVLLKQIKNFDKLTYKSFPCPRITALDKTQINLQGILLHITKMISVVFDTNLSDNLTNYEQNFKKRKNKVKKLHYKSTVFSGSMFESSNYVLPSIYFADELVNILKRLKLLPRSTRQKGLEIEIGMLNYNLPADVFVPIYKNKRILNVVSDFSYVLDSAENSPYFVVFEMCDYGNVYEEDYVVESPMESISSERYYETDDIGDLRTRINENIEQNEIIDDSTKSELNSSKNNTNENIKLSGDKSMLNMVKQDILDNTMNEQKMNIQQETNNEFYNMQQQDILDNTMNEQKINIQQELNNTYCSKEEYNTPDSTKNNSKIVHEDIVSNSDSHKCYQKQKSNIIDLPVTKNSCKLNLKYKKAVIIDLKTNKDFNIGYNTISSINTGILNRNNKSNEISLVYKNGAYLLHQLYDLQKSKSTNNSELSVIKENIINKIEDIKTEKKEYEKMSWGEKRKIIKENSLYRNYKGYDIVSMIIKRGNDLRLEVLALQLLKEMQRIFEETNLNIFLKCYKIILINNKSAYIEAINDVESIHNIKKKDKTLKEYFMKRHKEENNYKNAIKNFTVSLVGYSLATYFLQIKDRHNGNILIDENGYMIHVDYGFVLGNHPGFYNVERAPFKFSTDYIEIMDDTLFKSLFLEGFMVLRKNSDRLCRILEILAEKSKIKNINLSTLSLFRDRFKMELGDKEIEKWVSSLIDWSFNSIGTGLYDSYQYFSHGYMK